MQSFDSIFVHYPRFRVIICRACRIGVIPVHVAGHLSRQHSFVPKATRDEVVKYVERMRDVAHAPEDIVWPKPEDEPIPELEVFRDAVRCSRHDANGKPCTKICRSRQNMQAHEKKEHVITGTRARGRPKRGEGSTRSGWEPAYCQQVFRDAGDWKRLVQVGSVEASTGQFDEERQCKKRRFDEMVDARREIQQKRRMIIKTPSRYQANMWLVRTDWARDLVDMDPEQLVALMQPKPPQKAQPGAEEAVDAEEAALELACDVFKSMVFKAQAASQPNVIGHPANFYIDRREFGGESNEKPFYVRQMAKTIRKYVTIIQRVVRLIWRVDELYPGGPGPAPAQTGTDEGSTPVESIPRFTLTVDQNRGMTRVKHIARAIVSGGEITAEDKDQLSDVIVRFWVSILDHDIKDRASRNALISALAVMGIDEAGGWKSPLTYTPILSAVVTVSKMIVLYQAYLRRNKDIERITRERLNQDFDEETAKRMACEDAPAHFDLVQVMAHRFMGLTSHGGRPSPMDSILHLRTYGLTIRYDTTEAGQVDWHGERVLFGDIEFTMSALRGMAFGMIEECRRLLFRGLLLLDVDRHGELTKQGKATVPAIPWRDLVDNPSQRRAGWNVFMDKRNKFPVDGQTWLWDRIWTEEGLFREFVEESGSAQDDQVMWRETRLRQYRKEIGQFRELLLVLTHMLCGQGSRGSEVLTLQHRNGDDNTLRGMFIEDGLVAMVTAYHKGFGSSGKTKVIHRYAPRELGQLIVYDTWLVRPFWERMGTIIVKRPADKPPWEGDGPYFWEPIAEEEDEDDGEMEDEAGEIDGEVEDQSGDTRMNDMWTPDIWDSGRLRRALQRATLRWLGVRVNIMAWRHISIAIFRRWIVDPHVQNTIDEEEGTGGGGDAAFDLQAGHGSKIAGDIYGRLMSEAPFHTQARRAAFRRVSTAWHYFFRFPSEMEAPGRQVGPVASRIKHEVRDEQLRRWRDMRAVDLEQQLKAIVDPTAQFRGVQESALQAIMRQKSPVVVIMGTGGGKSVLFMLPARSSTGLTIVVVPLVSLREDLKDRCRAAGIECAEWDARRPHEWAQLVLVTPEAAVRASFANFINRQQADGRLDRIVIDECHVVLDSRSGWRNDILELRKLVRLETQLVYLTATLMPTEEREFMRCMGLPPKDKIQWFRAITERRNIAYRVVQCTRKDELSTLTAIVEEKMKQYDARGKIVIYCGSVVQTEELAVGLGAVCFHRNVGTQEHKSGVLQQLKASNGQRVFTATNALGLGVDAPTIRVVIHVGPIRRLRDYSQESGRAGRDGEISEAIVINTAKTESMCAWMDAGLKEFVWSGKCRRVVLGWFMDGVDRGPCKDDEQRCDMCGGIPVEIHAVCGSLQG